MTENINIKLTPPTYQDRRASVFAWTFLLYIFVAVVFSLSSDLQTLLFIIPCLTALFILDFSRRLLWVKYALDNIETDSLGIKLTYYDKDNLLSANISWNKLTISKGNTFTKNAKRIISFKNGTEKVASFYADTENGLDNSKIIELYNKLGALKTANA